MGKRDSKSLAQVIHELGRYPLEAFDFLKEALDYTVHHVHGEPAPAWKRIVDWMHQHDISPEDLTRRCRSRKLPCEIAKALQMIGGIEGLDSRHVSGPQLCLGLRELALKKWGFLASDVLRHWNIVTTRDVGEMVFALIDADLLQRRSDDSIEDFDDQYDFDEAFDRAYRIPVAAGA